MNPELSRLPYYFVKTFFHLNSLSAIDSCKVLKNEIAADKPSMIARFGSNEIKAVLYPKTPWVLRGILKKMMKYSPSEKEFLEMKLAAGFFPSTKDSITRFSKLMYEDMKELDVLGSWRPEERFLVSNFKDANFVPLQTLEPYLQEDPWSETLENKKILVIHPFNRTIESQYNNKRELLFKDARVLPLFKSLQTIRAVQSNGENEVKFEDWFEALDFMKAEIDTKDFDVAIIGAGAYGFPLAAHIKRMGKKAVHLGGATQILFGVKGNRWVENPNFKSIINEHFVFPSDEEKVNNISKVEDGCYW